MTLTPVREDWSAVAAALRPEGRAFIDGVHTEAATRETIACVSPIDGREVAALAACGEPEIDQAVKAARRAHDAGVWSAATPRMRKNVLRRLSELLFEHTEELAALITIDMGKPISEALREVDSTVRHVAFYSEAADKIYGEVGPSGPGTFAFVTKEPVGVVGAVTPWNFPLLLPAWKIAPALAVGNSVVVKPAEQASLAAIRLTELASEAGVPDGVLNAVPGRGPDAGRALGLHHMVDAVAFTGSTAVGKRFLEYAGQSNMKMVWLECGGKSPTIVLADAPDLELAAATTAESIFHNSGQVCNASSRLLLQSSIADRFLEQMVRLTRQWQPADPLRTDTKMGALVDGTQLRMVLDYVQVGIEEHGTVLTGGAQARTESGGFYMQPTVMAGVKPCARIAHEEIFGPVLACSVADSTEELLQQANDTIYGLAAAIWTSDLSTAHRVARRLNAGSVYVNCYDRGDNSLPFGGFKQSGYGVDRSLHAIEKYTRLKMTWMEV